MQVWTVVSGKPQDLLEDGAFLDGRTFETILKDHCNAEGGWTAEVAPHLLRLLAERVALGAGTISYGEAPRRSKNLG